MTQMEQTSMRQPSDWMAAFRAAAEKEGKPLAEWLGEAGKARLPKSVAGKLSERPPAHRPKKQGKTALESFSGNSVESRDIVLDRPDN